ncbi:DUF1566 domain-containing protein [Flavobacteriaceae bacterium]|nr:DUF1566 domain-containing protein [Flavobacteriaceae bacterium]
MRKITVIAFMLFTALGYAQVGINTNNPDASSALEIESTTGGILIPRLTETQRDDISAPAEGLMIYQTDGTAGFYYYNGSSWATLGASTSPTYNIGDIVNGGVVFWLDSTRQHGLVAAFSNVATAVEWGCFGFNLPNVSDVTSFPPIGLGAEIGDGFNNTNNILKDCPTAPTALAARSYGPDWFLPSTNELNQMYDNRATLEGVSGFLPFGNSYYWSSTKYSNNSAYIQRFNFDGQLYDGKNYANDVRAVRAF